MQSRVDLGGLMVRLQTSIRPSLKVSLTEVCSPMETFHLLSFRLYHLKSLSCSYTYPVIQDQAVFIRILSVYRFLCLIKLNVSTPGVVDYHEMAVEEQNKMRRSSGPK